MNLNYEAILAGCAALGKWYCLVFLAQFARQKVVQWIH